jgi:hypothetical protein
MLIDMIINADGLCRATTNIDIYMLFDSMTTNGTDSMLFEFTQVHSVCRANRRNELIVRRFDIDVERVYHAHPFNIENDCCR